MLDIVRFESDALTQFGSRWKVEHLVFSGDPLRAGSIVMLDGSTHSNRSLPSALKDVDLVFGCEWRGKDHMDHPGGAMRIQTARAIREASAIYLISPHVLDRFDVAVFNARVLRKAQVPVAFVSLATSEHELCSPLDAQGLGRELGFSDEEIARGRELLEQLPTTRFSKDFSVAAPR